MLNLSWFPVDDGAHSHPKMRKAGLEAVGLWTVSGSFCMGYLTDGFVPEWFVKEKPRGIVLAKRLVEAGLWRPGTKDGENGWWFHDWKPECTKKHIEEARANARQRKQKSRETARDDQRRSRVTDTVTGRVTDAERNAAVLGYPTQPNPTQPSNTLVALEGGVTSRNANDPRPRCPKHMNETGPIPPCGACAYLRQQAKSRDDALEAIAQAEKVKRRRAINACRDCDQQGMRDIGTGLVRCDHQSVAHA